MENQHIKNIEEDTSPSDNKFDQMIDREGKLKIKQEVKMSTYTKKHK